MATVDSLTPSGDQSSFKALPQPPSSIVRDQTSSFQSQTPEAPDGDERSLPRPDSLLALVPDRAPPRKSVLLEHLRKPSAGGSSIYSSSHTVGTIGTRRSWTNSPERMESASSLVWEEEEAANTPEPDSPVLGSKQEDHFELEEILKSTQIMHSNSISSTTSSGRPELWRRRSQRSDRSVKITDLKLANSNGFTASQPLRQAAAASDAPQIPLPAVPRKASHRPAVGLHSRPTQFINEKNMQSNAQPEQGARQYSHHTTQYSQLATGPAPYYLPAMQSQDNLEQTQPFTTKQRVREPVAPRPAPPQPETMGGRLLNFKNKFRSTEQLNQHRDIQTPGHTSQGSLDTVRPKPTGLMGKFRGTEDESVPAPSETKGGGSAFSKIKHKLRASDREDNSSPDLPSPEGSGWNLSKLKSKLRNSGNTDEAAPSTPTRTQPIITRLPTPDYQKQDPAPAPLTPLIHFPYSPQISPNDPSSRPGSGHGSRPPSRGRQFSFSQRPKLPPADASTSSIQTIASVSILDGKTSPVDPAQAHIHPLLRTKTSPSATDLSLPTTSAAPPPPQPPTIAISSPRFSPPATREPPRGRAASPKPLAPIVMGTAKNSAPGSKSLSPITTCQPPSPSTLSPASESSYKLQVPGEISKRMTTILESSPFLQIASSDPDDEVVYEALPLGEMQVSCYQGHRVMHRSRNDVYALACGVCGIKDREGRWCCAWCAVRCCEGCLEKVKGQGLAGEKVMRGGVVLGGRW
ncbi:hypothetical protein GMDG_00280 [Pseudogymnoascus destructans 20631-21]|uniref:Uncharacterized protein n=1 Tax=Pseudogymnoascus destructans (strain ATCC MYA-4855 / 20631-21) TaxID=658429 RepID=L8G1V4_PSED2|nr:hypothetical protein GMDG_00280 [Pseudogymnoascus destructans 20631-21]